MRLRALMVMLAMGALMSCSTGRDAEQAAATSTTVAPLTDESVIANRGVGPIRAGMTVVRAEKVGGVEFEISGFEDFGGFCYHGRAKDLPLALLVEPKDPQPLDDPKDGVITRVEINLPRWRTAKGVTVGARLDEVRGAYPGIADEPHKYAAEGRYLTDLGLGLRFSSEDGIVVDQIFSGTDAAIQLVEGCA